MCRDQDKNPDAISIQEQEAPFGEIGGGGVSSSFIGRAGMVGLLTLLSRICGLLRDSAIAYVLGTKAAADAFYVAFRIPNLFRRLVAEGNLTISFVPVFTESLHRSKKEAKEVVDITFTLLVMFLAVLSFLGIVGAGLFVSLTARGFSADPEKFHLTVLLTKITFPYIFFVSLAALAMGILNARKHFICPALAPVLLNLGIIIGTFFFSTHFSRPSIGIAWGVLLGGTLQLLLQVPPLVKHGFFPRIRFNIKHPSVRKIVRLMLPSVYGSAVYQLNLVAITFMASYLPTGAISFLWYADRVIEFPLGIFAVSFATVVLPTLSDHAVKNNVEEMKKTLRHALSMVWLVNIPAAVGLIVMAKPILALLFYRGDFTTESTILTAQALQCFAIGLPFVSATRITASAFYAVQEARKPVRAANFAVLVNIVVGAILLFPLGYRGLALGVSTGSIANFLLITWYYRKKVGKIGFRSLLVSVGKIFLASIVMGASLLVLQHYWDLSFAPTLPRLGYVAALMALGVLVYGLSILPLRVEGSEALLKLILRKK